MQASHNGDVKMVELLTKKLSLADIDHPGKVSTLSVLTNLTYWSIEHLDCSNHSMQNGEFWHYSSLGQSRCQCKQGEKGVQAKLASSYHLMTLHYCRVV